MIIILSKLDKLLLNVSCRGKTVPNYEFIDQFECFFALVAEKQDKKDALTQKQDSPVENRTPGNPIYDCTERVMSRLP